MKHLLICREYPPAAGGGIGTYAVQIARLLAECGETVHVIGQLWEGAEKRVEEGYQGNLIVHRVPLNDWTSLWGPKPHPDMKCPIARSLFASDFYPQCFSWQASLLAEQLVKQEGIDVIEAQEYEAPLYYFQVRRSLGLGPKACPPCIVHLHSPTEDIVRHNEWDIHQPYFQTTKRLEDFSIAAADALLCPSRYLAHQVETRYGLPGGTVQTIPYPADDFPMVPRVPHVWNQGSVAYLGRLERRKGVIEWIDATVAVAAEYPASRFEFVGANVLGTEELLQRRIPRALRDRFHFFGPQPRRLLPAFLARARMAAVPSRWENFPNSCIEAMSSGLPVLASRQGGMVEMVQDGRTGWLPNQPGTAGLIEALRRALETNPERLEEMGREASREIRRLCDSRRIVEQQLEFRSRLVPRGARRSLRLPANLSCSSAAQGCRAPDRLSRAGLALVVIHSNSTPERLFRTCLRSIAQQTRKPAAVLVLHLGPSRSPLRTRFRPSLPHDWQLVVANSEDMAASKNAAVEAVLAAGADPLGFVFLAGDEQLQSNFVADCEAVLQQCPGVGIVSHWIGDRRRRHRMWLRPCPSFPYQGISNDASSCSVLRTQALREAGGFRAAMQRGREDWNLINAVMAEGWIAVTFPAPLVARSLPRSPQPVAGSPGECPAMLRKALRNPHLAILQIWKRVRGKLRRRIPVRIHFLSWL